MLNSSSAFSLISEAFSEASCWMNRTICAARRREGVGHSGLANEAQVWRASADCLARAG